MIDLPKETLVVSCDCGSEEFELWVPPVVRCKKCGSLYPWAMNSWCVSGEKLGQQLIFRLEDKK